MVHGLSLATIRGRWLAETPFVQVSMTWTLTCPETVHLRPCMKREIKTWLSDSTVVSNSVVDHRSWRPVLSPQHNCIYRCHVWPVTILGVEMQAVEVDAQRHQHTQAIMDGLWLFEALSVTTLWHRGAKLLSTGSHESCIGCRQPEIRRTELWSWVSMRFV